jgi:para-nitrobenzyl esterase
VVVTVNYRVNVFGFFAHPELTAKAPEAPTNFGHLDQQFGTRWVKRNIKAFGGDPDNITIGGQSAGGMSVAAQLVAPQNEGLFQKAIIQSGIFMSPYGRVGLQSTMKEAEDKGVKFLKLLGVKTLDEARRLDAVFIRDKMLEEAKPGEPYMTEYFR